MAKKLAEVTEEELAQQSANAIIYVNVERLLAHNDLGEIELLLMFLRLLHARRHQFDVGELANQRADFDQQMKEVFVNSGT